MSVAGRGWDFSVDFAGARAANFSNELTPFVEPGKSVISFC